VTLRGLLATGGRRKGWRGTGGEGKEKGKGWKEQGEVRGGKGREGERPAPPDIVV